MSAMIFSVIADVSPPDSRTKYFYYMEVADYTTQLIAPSLASLLMKLGIWIPFGVGIFAAVVAILIVFILPETAPSRLDRDLIGTRQPSATEAAHVHDLLDDEHHLSQPEIQVRKKCCAMLHKLRDRSLSMPENKVIRFLISLLLAATARTSLPLLQQFASKELRWTIAQVRKSSLLLLGESSSCFHIADQWKPSERQPT